MDETKNILERKNDSDSSLPSYKSFSRKSANLLYRVLEELCMICRRRSWCALTKSRALLLVTSLASVTIVLLFQCFFWNDTPVGLCCRGQIDGDGTEREPGKFLAAVSLWGKRERDMTESKKRHQEIEYRQELAKKSQSSVNFHTEESIPINTTVHDTGNDTDIAQRLPQCLIVGVRKGGTRALLEFLSLHPQIATNRAEIHFFDNEENYSQGLEWYRTSMTRSTPDQITIEKTPAYFVNEAVPERVYMMNRSIKLLLIVRDPVERAISDFDQIRVKNERLFKPDVSFEELAIRDSGRVNDGYAAVRRGVYHRYMSRWLRYFPLEQFHLVSGEQLVKDPLPELRKIEVFLNLPARLNQDMFYMNKTRGFYCMRNMDGQQERCLARSKGREHPYVSPSCIEKLERYYRPHNIRFYRMVGIDFGWPE